MREAYPHLFKDEDGAIAGMEEPPAEEMSGDIAVKETADTSATDTDVDDAVKNTEIPDKQSAKIHFSKKLFQKRNKKQAP